MEKLRTAVVGLNMGRNHCRIFNGSSRFQVEAICDIDPARTQWVLDNITECRVFDDYGKMLAEVRPDVVVVATPNDLHCAMTLMAVQYGVRGIYCEKPMAVSMLEAKTMVESCRSGNVQLMIGHQRRLTPVYRTMKRLMDEGAIGDVYLIRGTCAGDFLSDGTHTVDSIRYLLDDATPEWLLSSVFRLPMGTPLWADHVFTGRRYGHSIESGAQAVLEFPGKIRAEILTGSLWFPNRGYQDIEVFGTKGRIWRAGDSAKPDILIQDEKAGGFREVPVDRPEADESLLDGGGHGANIAERNHVVEGFADMIQDGSHHPMDGFNAIKTHEIVMAIYESARIHDRILFPLKQDRFPLDIMLENGEIK
jgi:UDP-N-acetyl-2-amino-2-deoxyglucuronate dehydrogenase